MLKLQDGFWTKGMEQYSIDRKLEEARNVTLRFMIVWESYCTDILYYFSLMTDEGTVNMKTYLADKGNCNQSEPVSAVALYLGNHQLSLRVFLLF
jgi:hypothetical protein